MVCLPKNPRCLLCPLMKICKAREAGTQELRPVMKPKKKIPTYVHAAAVVVERGRVLLSQRPADGLLGGMWEFPNARIDGDPAKELVKALRGATRIKVRIEPRFTSRSGRSPLAPPARAGVTSAQAKKELGSVSHAYSHFKVKVYPFWCVKVEIPKDKKFKWVRLDELDDYPMGKVDRQIAKKVGQA
jgi:A/G-specific adenine glycosylase